MKRNKVQTMLGAIPALAVMFVAAKIFARICSVHSAGPMSCDRMYLVILSGHR